MTPSQIAVHSIYGETTLADSEWTQLTLTYDGQSVEEIPIPDGRFVISDAIFGRGFVYFAFEVNRGSGYTPIATFGFVLTSPIHSEVKRFKTGIVVNGGPGVTFRVRVKAVSAPPVSVNVTLRAYMAG